MAVPHTPRTSVDDVIVPPEPAPRRQAHLEKEALLALSHSLAREPASAVQRLVELAMKLTGAESAGVSLEDTEAGEAVFRWVAAAGEFARHLNGTVPRQFSPCGTVLERRQTLVMHEPARHYEYIAAFGTPIREALLVPFSQRGALVGTVWVASHRKRTSFTQEDVRVVEGLTTFSSALLDTLRHSRG